MKKNSHQLVLTTCPDNDTAGRIARALVEDRLAACVNILPVMQSVYLWKGNIETEAEHLLLIKSRQSRYREIEKRIQALHPYELPEIIAVPISEGLKDYLSWLDNPD